MGDSFPEGCKSPLKMMSQDTVGRIVDLVPMVSAVVFLAAALLKIHYLRSNVVMGEGPLNARWFSTLLLQVELLISGLLLTPNTRRVGVFASIVLLILFSVYNLNLWTHGAMACGCLGALSARPQVMAAIDVALVTLLIVWRYVHKPRLKANLPASRRTAALFFSHRCA